MVGYPEVEGTVSGTPAWRLYDLNGTAVAGSLYTLDYQRGIVTFDADRRGSTYLVDARSYDLQGAASDGWRELAGSKAQLYKFTADGATYDRNQWFDHCVKMDDYYQSMSTTKSTHTGYFWRSDVSY